MLRRTLLAGAFAAGATAASADETSALKVVMVGTGTPIADPQRSGQCVAIVKGAQSILVDAGAGVVRRASAAAERYQMEALRPPHLDTVFLTHLHSDHTVGLPDLMLSPWVLDRTAALSVFGPPGTARMVGLLQEAYSEDVDIRLHGGEPSNPTGWRSEPHEINGAGLVQTFGDVRVEAVPVLHGSWAHAFGYRISDGARTIVVSGDTRPCPALVEAARGADVLVHEVYSTQRFATRPPEWQRYHSAFHTSTRELAAIANEARPGLLVLNHQLFWGASEQSLIDEIRAFGYAGPLASAHDLDMF